MKLESILDYLPQSEGWLANWQLLVAVMAVFNSVQNFVTLKLTRRIYNNIPSGVVSPIHARTFAAWTMTAAVVRTYAAYHIHDKSIYDMALFTYLIAFGHFTSELLIFRTARLNVGIAGPLVVASTSLVWMIKQYNFYVKVAPPEVL